MSTQSKTDRVQIEELMARYANALDRRDYEAIAACFAPDAVVEYAGFSHKLSGRAAITDHMMLALGPLDATQHLFANFIIDVAGESARLTCDILGQHIRHGAPGGESYLSGGKYDVVLARATEGWQFARLSAQSLWGVGNRGILPSA